MVCWLLVFSVHGHYGFVLALCRVLGSLQNVEIIYSIYYDKTELLRLNSTENKVVAYTEYAMKWADDLNKKPEWLHNQAEKNIKDCKRFGQLFLPMIEKAGEMHWSKHIYENQTYQWKHNINLIISTVKPEVIIRSVRQARGKSPAMLICSAYDFYPKPIKLTWMRDDKEVTADVTSTEELADGDWYYQIHSHLEYFPKPGEKISCVVEHASSHKPMIYHWGKNTADTVKYDHRHQTIVSTIYLFPCFHIKNSWSHTALQRLWKQTLIPTKDITEDLQEILLIIFQRLKGNYLACCI